MRNVLIIVLGQLVCALAEVRVEQSERSNGRPVYSITMNKSSDVTFMHITQWLKHLMLSIGHIDHSIAVFACQFLNLMHSFFMNNATTLTS